MSSFTIVDQQDTRYETLKKGFNLRFPEEGQGAEFIYICNSAESVHSAANDALAQGLRITVRSGGHCYEGFVSNKLPEDDQQQLAIIDLSLMTGLTFREEADISSPYNQQAKYKFCAATGTQNWDGYLGLYKSANRTLPGGSCYSVGAGGHISGGGYGLLSRLHGLTVDWLSGVDILVPAEDGKSLIARHVNLDSQGVDRDLFIACRGAGGGNYGIILNYYFHELPPAPQQAYLLSLAWPWATFTDKSQLATFLNTYWQWFKDHDADWNSDDISKANGGLFTLLKLQHRSTGDINLLVQFTGNDGRVDGAGQTDVLSDFVIRMNQAAGSNGFVTSHNMSYGPIAQRNGNEPQLRDPLQDGRLMDWLAVTQNINGSGNNQYGKYKSFHQIGNFSADEIDAIWQYFNVENDPYLNQTLLQIDSYGGCINANDENLNPTSIYQRSSLLKSQLQVYWSDANAADHCLAWCRDFYSAYFKNSGGKPYADDGRYDGCYINYPDVDMKYLNNDRTQIDPRWMELFYGPKTAMLINTKVNIDPGNVFRNEISIPLTPPDASGR